MYQSPYCCIMVRRSAVSMCPLNLLKLVNFPFLRKMTTTCFCVFVILAYTNVSNFKLKFAICVCTFFRHVVVVD